MREIAINKLRALRFQVYITKGQVWARLRLEPGQFPAVAGLAVAEDQSVLVQGDNFVFVGETPLRHVGPIEFLKISDRAQLDRLLGERFTKVATRLTQTLERARQYLPNAELSPRTLMVEAVVQDNLGEAVFRFDARVTQLAVVKIDGQALKEPSESLLVALPEERSLFGMQALQPAMHAARSALERAADQAPEASFIDIGNLDDIELPGDEKPKSAPTAPPASPASAPASKAESASVSLDLEQASADLETASQAERLAGLSVPTSEAEQLERIQPSRTARLATLVPARMRWAQQDRKVDLVNVNLGGVFAASKELDIPIGTHVQIASFGTYVIRGRVAHNRPAAEGEYFGTSQGVGIAFVEDEAAVHMKERQEAPFGLIVMDEGDMRHRAVQVLAKSACPMFLARNLVDAAVCCHYFRIGPIVLADRFQDQSWEAVAECLGLAKRDSPSILMSRRTDLGPLPAWLRLVPH